jgi:hypothetical protein
MKVVAHGAAIRCKPSPMTCPPAVVASSDSSSSESRVSLPFRDFSSTPTRKTRSVLRFLVSISAFNSLLLLRSLSFVLSPENYHKSAQTKSAIFDSVWTQAHLITATNSGKAEATRARAVPARSVVN